MFDVKILLFAKDTTFTARPMILPAKLVWSEPTAIRRLIYQ